MVDWIRNWITAICIAVIFITAVELILPGDKFKKYVKFVMGLILIAVILNPIIQLINKNSDVSTYIDNANKYFDNADYSKNYEKYKISDSEDTLNTFEINLENTCTKILKDKFPESSYSVAADVNYKNSEITIDSLKITTENTGIKAVEKIKINSANTEDNSKKELNNEISKKIKDYLAGQLKISKDIIHVY